jgi:hypothetical protein
MSPRTATLAILGALTFSLCSGPTVAAAAISLDDDPVIKLGLDATLIQANRYEVLAGGFVHLKAGCTPDWLLWLFVAGDNGHGSPDYSAMFTLFLDYVPAPPVETVIPIPPELEGLRFHLRGAAQSPDGLVLEVGPSIRIDVVSSFT